MKLVCAVLIWALGVYSASSFGVGIPIPLNIGDSQHSAQVSVSGDGIGVTEHKEAYSEDKEHSESHSKTSHKLNQKDGSSTHVSQDSAKSDQVHDSTASHSETEDRGVALGLSGGLQLFDNKQSVDDKKTFDQESGRNRSMSQDETATSKHNESSGSEYTRTRESFDHHEDHDNKALSLGGGKGLFNHQYGSTDSHDASEQENGSSWAKMKDYKHDVSRTSISSVEKSTKYSKASKETHEDDSSNVHQNSGNGLKNGIDPSEILKLIREEAHKGKESSKLNSTQKPQITQSNFAQDYLKALRESIFNTDSTQKPIRQKSGNTVVAGNTTHAGNTVKAKTNASSHYANLLAISSLYNKPQISVSRSSNRPNDNKDRNSDVIDQARVKYIRSQDVYNNNNKSANTGKTAVSNNKFDGPIKDMVKKRRHFKAPRGYRNKGLSTNDNITLARSNDDTENRNDNITLARSNDVREKGYDNITLATSKDTLHNVHDNITLAESNDGIINDYDNSTLARSNDSIHSDDENSNTEIKKIRHASNEVIFEKVDEDSHLSQSNMSEPEEDIDTSHGTNKQDLYESAIPRRFSKGYVNAQHTDVDNRNKHNVTKIEEEKEEDDSLKVIPVNAQNDGILIERENVRNNSQNIDANNSHTQGTAHHRNNNHSLEPDSHRNPESVSENEQVFQKVHKVPDIETETLAQDAVDTSEDIVKELDEVENVESSSNIKGKANLPDATGPLHDNLESGQKKNYELSENDDVNKKTARNKSNRDNDQVSTERNYDIEDIDYTSEEVQQGSSKTKNSTELNSSEELISDDDYYEEMYDEDNENIMNEEEQTIKNPSSDWYSIESDRNVTITPETVADNDESTNAEIHGQYTGVNMNESYIVGVDDGSLSENDYKDLNLNITSTTKSINIKEITKLTNELNSSVENDSNVPVSSLDKNTQYEGTNKTKEGDHIDQNSSIKDNITIAQIHKSVKHEVSTSDELNKDSISQIEKSNNVTINNNDNLDYIKDRYNFTDIKTELAKAEQSKYKETKIEKVKGDETDSNTNDRVN